MRAAFNPFHGGMICYKKTVKFDWRKVISIEKQKSRFWFLMVLLKNTLFDLIQYTITALTKHSTMYENEFHRSLPVIVIVIVIFVCFFLQDFQDVVELETQQLEKQFKQTAKTDEQQTI